MKLDYTYCLNGNSCLNRLGCRRWLGNYKDEQVKQLTDSKRDMYIVDEECIKSEPYPYNLLDRFRGSDGKEINNNC